MGNILIVTYSIIAAIIGAGFASGQEMLLYFVRFNRYGILGIGVSIIAFTLFIYAVLSRCISHKVYEFDSFLDVFRKPLWRYVVRISTLVFSFAVFGAMLSASGEMLFDFLGIPRALGTLLCAIGATVLFSISGERIFTFNGMLGIVLVLLITFSALYMLCYREFHAFSPQVTASSASALIYSGYNLVSLTPVLVTLSKRLKSRTDAIAVSLSVGVASAIIMTLIFGLISIYAGKISLGELPMLTLAKRQSAGFFLMYSFVLAAAIMTTLISSGGGLCTALMIKNKPIKIALLSMGAYLLASFGFSNLIDTAYRLCGIVGLGICIIVIFACFRHKPAK